MSIDIISFRYFNCCPQNVFHDTHDDPLVLEKCRLSPSILSLRQSLIPEAAEATRTITRQDNITPRLRNKQEQAQAKKKNSIWGYANLKPLSPTKNRPTSNSVPSLEPAADTSVWIHKNKDPHAGASFRKEKCGKYID